MHQLFPKPHAGAYFFLAAPALRADRCHHKILAEIEVIKKRNFTMIEKNKSSPSGKILRW